MPDKDVAFPPTEVSSDTGLALGRGALGVPRSFPPTVAVWRLGSNFPPRYGRGGTSRLPGTVPQRQRDQEPRP